MRDKEGKKISYTHIKEFATVLVIVKRECVLCQTSVQVLSPMLPDVGF